MLTPLFSFFLGACSGSFLNVCLFRWKSDGQVFSPPSFCPHCKKTIRWFDNIPIISFFLLKGKCRFCHHPISFQYPIIETVTAVLFCLSSLVFREGSALTIIMSYFFVSFLVLFAVSDLKWRLLPHVFNNFFILFGLVFMAFGSFLGLFYAVGDSIIIGSLMFGLIQFFPNSMGGGDIKLIMGLGIWMGFFKMVCVIFISFGLGALLALILLAKNKVTRKSLMPFGPFLAIGALVVWFFPNFFRKLM